MTDVPSTPSWMTDQRQGRRQNRRGYGRRYSGIGSSVGGGGGGGGSSSTITKKSRRGSAALFGTTATVASSRSGVIGGGGSMLNFDEEEHAMAREGEEVDDADEELLMLDRSANGRLQGRGKKPPPPPRSNFGGVESSLDQSAHARLESRSSSRSSGSGGLDLIDEFGHHHHMSKPKKKRPNLPRPPRAKAKGSSSSSSSSQQFTTPKVQSNAFDFESEPMNSSASGSGSGATSSNDSTPTDSSAAAAAVDGSSLENPISLLDDDTPMKVGTRRGGYAKRSKISTYRRSNSTAPVMTRNSSSSLFVEENVHPNDTTASAAASSATADSTTNKGTRRSSRLEKKYARRASVSGGLSSRNGSSESSINETAKPSVTTRSRAKANSKKRSNTFDIPLDDQELGQQQEQHEPSPPKIATRSTSLASFSSGSISSSNNSTIRTASTTMTTSNSVSGISSMASSSSNAAASAGAGRAESFSSLARFGQNNWAAARAKKGFQHKRSVSAAHFATNKSNSASSSSFQHKRSVSAAHFANNRSQSASSATTSALKTPSMHHQRSISCGGDLSLSSSIGDNNNRLLSMGEGGYSPPSPFLSPEGGGGGSILSTPLVGGSTSSRKRRTMHFTSSPPLNDDDEHHYDLLGGSERCRTSRKLVPSLPFTTMDQLSQSQHAIHEFASPATSLMRSESQPIGPGDMFSPPPPSPTISSSLGKSSLNSEMMCHVGSNDNLDEKKDDDVRDPRRLSSDNDESMMSTESDDGSTSSSLPSSSEDYEDADDEDEGETPREMTDLEIFESKSSYDDFKFLTKSLQKWSQSSSSNYGKGAAVASMGLNSGCLIAVPPSWTFEHRANFAKWVAMAFGFRVGSVGGAGCGSFLRCSDGEGKEALARLRRILNDYKGGRLALPSSSSVAAAAGASNAASSGSRRRQDEKPKAKLPIKLSSKPRFPPSLNNGPTLSMSPLCDGFVGDLLADEMKHITLDEKKAVKINSSSVPQFIRSMTLQPLASKIKNTTLPCFRNNSPRMETGRKSSGGGGGRLPRLSSESAIGGSDFMNLFPGMGSSPSPLPNRLPRKLSRALQPAARRPSLEKLRPSFERPGHHQGCIKPFESPHPRNTSLALETPSSRLEFGLETPMPKQVENWGSRPVFGKDWGESVCCCDGTIDACSQVFAKSWFTSDFYGNEDLSAQYRVALEEEDETHLFAFYDADADLDDDDDDSELASINGNSLDLFSTEVTSKRIGFVRCDSVGASALDLLHLDDKLKDFGQSPSYDRRRTMKLRKYARMSLCVAAASDFLQPKLKRCYRLSETPTKKRPSLNGTPINSIVENRAFSNVLSFLKEGELIHSASLVCSSWADAAAEALGNLMLVSVGCDPSLNDDSNDDNSSEFDDSDLGNSRGFSSAYSSVAKSMLRGWPHLMDCFPWAQFLSDGAFKKVYKVWNNRCGVYEALSVMDVNAIDDLGNLNLVGTELAVSVLLSSLARRNICPNFVVTRGVFTCQHEPPTSLWGCRDDAAPRGISFDGHAESLEGCGPKPDQCGNYQYIRMELCQHGDVEEHIKNHPVKMLSPWDCRNLLFQMAFALHVAGNRFGLKHYDVKLLNFLLQSAKDPTIADAEHPHVVLRYGVGSHVFRLRMHPSSAHIAKLADYGTSVMRTDSDGQPVSLGQFTTLENTPPDFLILGNTAEQGYGHDCFGLGLCMLHLFTGHGPYEEILDDVVCPGNLKGKLRKIWKQKSHDVICSVMLDCDENGVETEDQTLYDTLYRFLVLFGIPEKQFGIKKHGKVWRAINTTLLPPTGQRSKKCPDMDVFNKDRKKFSLADGTDTRIAGARRRLQEMHGAMDLLLSLVSFDPKTRATPLDVINSRFMADLIEGDGDLYCDSDMVKSYTAYLTN